jgi:squalene-hopene/tetraprenyl-beta-curcumene cyclase
MTSDFRIAESMLMRKKAFIVLLLLAGAGLIGWQVVRRRAAAEVPAGGYLQHWDPARAAAYLDSREQWWQNWPPAKKVQGTFCVSCHTALPYAMARPLLQQATETTAPPEKALIDSIEKRVTNWAQMPPYYSDHAGPGKAAQSRATEAVLNAVILANEDARQGHLRPVTRTAFDEAWALQETTGQNAGGWLWQDFSLAPWETAEAAYQGAALLAEKAEAAPDGYATLPDTQSYLDRLWSYLQRGYAQQSLMNQLYVLWASYKSPQRLTAEQRESLFKALRSVQHADGGWSLSELTIRPDLDTRQWLRKRAKLLLYPPLSDGCATGLAVFVLQQSGMSRQDSMLSRGMQWLQQHQRTDGSWQADSLNARRDPNSGVGRFMSDAATGYAVMALKTAPLE